MARRLMATAGPAIGPNAMFVLEAPRVPDDFVALDDSGVRVMPTSKFVPITFDRRHRILPRAGKAKDGQ